MLHFDKIPLYGCFILSFGIGTIVALLIAFLFVPYMKQKIDGEFEMAESNSKSSNGGNLASEGLSVHP